MISQKTYLADFSRKKGSKDKGKRKRRLIFLGGAGVGAGTVAGSVAIAKNSQNWKQAALLGTGIGVPVGLGVAYGVHKIRTSGNKKWKNLAEREKQERRWSSRALIQGGLAGAAGTAFVAPLLLRKGML
jgi:hypothetical protein